MNNKLVVLDWMRAVAILVILFHHLPGYTFNYYNLNSFGIPLDLSIINVFNRYIGLSLFVFTSGYLLNLKKNRSFGLNETKKFISKRWIRIFPLYLIALVAFIFMHESFNPISIFFHSTGLQLLTKSPILKPLPTLWFIGLIIVYYSIFLIWKSRLNQNIKSCIILGFPILVFALNKTWQLTDFRLLLYYGVFWFGIYCGANKILDQLSKSFSFIFLSILVLISLLMGLTEYEAIRSPGNSVLNLLTINVWMICFVSFSYYALRYLPRQGFVFYLAEKVAYSSYCLYLFHRPILAVSSKIFQKVIPGDNIVMYSVILVVITLPALLIICQKIQQVYDQQITPYLTACLETIASIKPNHY